MKKSLLALTLALAATLASATEFASIEIGRATNNDTGAASQVQTTRFVTDAGKLSYGLALRTQVYEQGGLSNSIEGTVGTSIATVVPLTVHVGLGHDNGTNGVRGSAYQYGLVGVTTGHKIGPVTAFAGAQSRVNWETNAPKQNLFFVGGMVSLTKSVSATLSVSRSFLDIREDQVGVELSMAF